MMNKVVTSRTSQNEPQCEEKKEQRSPVHRDSRVKEGQRYVKAFYGSQGNLKTLLGNLGGSNVYSPPNSF